MNEIQTRRKFIKSFTLLAGSSAIISSLPWISALKAETLEKIISPSDKVRLAIIGIGSRGLYLMDFIKQMPDVEMVAVCDNYKPNLELGLRLTDNKAKSTEDYRQLLDSKDIDGVIIAVPPGEHGQITVDFLNAGKQVFCEKSMALTIEDCRRMYETAKSTGKILQIGHQRMFDSQYLKAYELAKSGYIGQITQIRAYWHRNQDWRRPVPSPELERKINWRLYKDTSRGLMTELGSHQLQVANWFLGQAPKTIMGIGSTNYWKQWEVYDNVNLIYAYPCGVQAIYDSISNNKHYGLEEQIMGTKGTIEPEIGKYYQEDPPPAPGIQQLINQLEHNVFDVIPIGGPSWIPETAANNKGEYLLPKKNPTDGSDHQLVAFVQSIKQGKPIAGILEHGYCASIATLLGHQAMETKQIIEWPEDIKVNLDWSIA